jgi:asparagine synthase (glutamine-hydrolysing)
MLPHPYYFSRALFSPREVASAGGAEPGSWHCTAWWNWLSSAANEASSTDAFTGISWLELRSYLPNVLLRDTDAMSMSHSLEVRVPFLDAPLVDYLLSIPQAAKSDPKRPKALLIEALGKLLPQEIVTQRKRTFIFPWENWLRGKLGQRVSDGLADWSSALAPMVRPDFARSVWRDFVAGKTTWSRPWSLFVLNEWAKRSLRAGAASQELHTGTAAVSAA